MADRDRPVGEATAIDTILAIARASEAQAVALATAAGAMLELVEHLRDIHAASGVDGMTRQ